MDIKELNKKQLILLTFLITFVVSVATGIVTVSLMNQMPKNVPQTINNVIQRTIEKVNTIEVPTKDNLNIKSSTAVNSNLTYDESALVPIYPGNVNISSNTNAKNNETDDKLDKPLGYGVIISDVGLLLTDSTILSDKEGSYKVVLNNIEFNASILKEFNNGFVVLKISPNKSQSETTGYPKTENTKVNPTTL